MIYETDLSKQTVCTPLVARTFFCASDPSSTEGGVFVSHQTKVDIGESSTWPEKSIIIYKNLFK